MKHLVLLSDIHANLHALSAVLEQIKDSYPAATIACLGDTVGYGGNPSESLRIIRELADPALSIGGNHDYGLVGLPQFDIDYFNSQARRAIEIHRDLLNKEETRWLEKLPKYAQTDDVLLCHGSPLDTNHYIMDELDVLAANRHVRTHGRRLICFGHTHAQLFAPMAAHEVRLVYPFDGNPDSIVSFGFSSHDRLYINPGSVGQPRDGDPRAAFACLDFENREVLFHRVEYDIDAAAEAIRAAKLPIFLADRLYSGT